MYKIKLIISLFLLNLVSSCTDSEINKENYYMIDRSEYSNNLEGFWLGQSIANWTGLILKWIRLEILVKSKQEIFIQVENWGKKANQTFGYPQVNMI